MTNREHVLEVGVACQHILDVDVGGDDKTCFCMSIKQCSATVAHRGWSAAAQHRVHSNSGVSGNAHCAMQPHWIVQIEQIEFGNRLADQPAHSGRNLSSCDTRPDGKTGKLIIIATAMHRYRDGVLATANSKC